MKILGLPGINPGTEQWMQKLLESLNLARSETIIQRYQCWAVPGSSLNIESEARIAAITRPDIVIAKSIGTRIAIYAYTGKLMSAKTCILLGIPVRGCSNDEISALQEICANVPTLLIQQTDDPAGSFSVVTSMIPHSPTCQISEVPGNDHRYGNIDQLRQIIESWYPGRGT